MAVQSSDVLDVPIYLPSHPSVSKNDPFLMDGGNKQNVIFHKASLLEVSSYLTFPQTMPDCLCFLKDHSTTISSCATKSIFDCLVIIEDQTPKNLGYKGREGFPDALKFSNPSDYIILFNPFLLSLFASEKQGLALP